MKLISFPEQTTTIAEHQQEYQPMPAHISLGPEGETTCVWKLTWHERLAVFLTGKVWHQIWTFHQPLQRQLLHAVKPELRP